MANEITYSLSLSATRGAASVASGSITGKMSMLGTEMSGGITQTVPTSATAVNTGAFSGAAAAVLIKNLDTTNYVDVGAENTAAVDPDRVRPGGAILRSPTAALYAKANTASVQILIVPIA